MKKIVDLSKWQGEIDFSKLKDDVEFVILRVQYGSTTIDSKYKEYVAGCKKYNIPFGSYAYARFINEKDAEIEAKDFLNRVDKDSIFLVVDVEEQTTKTRAEMLPASKAYIQYLKKNDKRPVGLYSGESFYNLNGLKDSGFNFLWLANYGVDDGKQHTAPKIPCDLWQFTSKGRVDGVNGNVDLNIICGKKDVNYFTGKKPVEAKPVIKVEKKEVDGVVYIVKSGDNLTNIAKKYGVSIDKIVQLNKLKDPDELSIGQKLIIKNDAKPKPQKLFHIVKYGDTVSELSKKYGSSVSDLCKWNGINTKTFMIYVGEKLRVK
jgi:GH25 family lysozyme M1 (1,4-beta-N-acetylmuramidase)